MVVDNGEGVTDVVVQLGRDPPSLPVLHHAELSRQAEELLLDAASSPFSARSRLLEMRPELSGALLDPVLEVLLEPHERGFRETAPLELEVCSPDLLVRPAEKAEDNEQGQEDHDLVIGVRLQGRGCDGRTTHRRRGGP